MLCNVKIHHADIIFSNFFQSTIGKFWPGVLSVLGAPHNREKLEHDVQGPKLLYQQRCLVKTVT